MEADLVAHSGPTADGSFVQTLPLTVDKSLVDAASRVGWTVSPDSVAYPLMKLTLAQVAPILPYLLLVLVLMVRPRGLFGTRDD